MDTSTIPIGQRLQDTGAVLDLGAYVGNIVNLAIILAGLAVLLFLVLAGYGWLTAGGDKQKVEESRSRITNAIIGLAIVAAAFAVYSVVDSFFGIGNIKPYKNPSGGYTDFGSCAAGCPAGKSCQQVAPGSGIYACN